MSMSMPTSMSTATVHCYGIDGHDVQLKIERLMKVTPYSLDFYLSKSKSVIDAMYNRHLGSIAKYAQLADEQYVSERVKRTSRPSGEFHLIRKNKKSIRFKFVIEGSERHAMMTTYFRNGYYDATSGGDLGNDVVQVTWDNDKSAFYRVPVLISFLCDKATNDVSDLIRAIHAIKKECARP